MSRKNPYRGDAVLARALDELYDVINALEEALKDIKSRLKKLESKG